MPGEQDHLIQLFKIMNDSSSTSTRVREKQTKAFLDVLSRMTPKYLAENTKFLNEWYQHLPNLTGSYRNTDVKHYLFFAILLWLGQTAFAAFVKKVKIAQPDILVSILNSLDRHYNDLASAWKHGESKAFVHYSSETIIGLAAHYLDNNTFNEIFLNDISKITNNNLIQQRFLIGTLAIKGNVLALKEILKAVNAQELMLQLLKKHEGQLSNPLLLLAQYAPELLSEILPALLDEELNAQHLKKFVEHLDNYTAHGNPTAFFEAVVSSQSWDNLVKFIGGKSETAQSIAIDNMAIYFSNLHSAAAFKTLEACAQKNTNLIPTQRDTLLKEVKARNTLLNMFAYLLERPGRRITRDSHDISALLDSKDQHDFTQRFNDFLNIITVILSTHGEDLQTKLSGYINATQINFSGFFSNEYQNLRGQLLALNSKELRAAYDYLKIFLAKKNSFSIPESMRWGKTELIARVQARIAYTAYELPRNTRPDEIFPVTPPKHRLMQLRQLVEEKKEADFLNALNNENDINLVAHFAFEYFNSTPPFNLLRAVLANFSENTFLKLYQKIIIQVNSEFLRDILFTQEGRKLLLDLFTRVGDEHLAEIIRLKQDVFHEVFIKMIKEEARQCGVSSATFTPERLLMRQLIAKILLKSPDELFDRLEQECEAEIKAIASFNQNVTTEVAPKLKEKFGKDILQEWGLTYYSTSNTPDDMLVKILLQDEGTKRAERIIKLVITNVMEASSYFLKVNFLLMLQKLPYSILEHSFNLLKSSTARRHMPYYYSYFINEKQYDLVKETIGKNPQLSSQEKLQLKFDILIGALIHIGPTPMGNKNNVSDSLLYLIADMDFTTDFILNWLNNNITFSSECRKLSQELANCLLVDGERQLFKQVLMEYQKHSTSGAASDGRYPMYWEDKTKKWASSRDSLLEEQREYVSTLLEKKEVKPQIPSTSTSKEQKVIALHHKAVEKYGSFKNASDKAEFAEWYAQLRASLRENKINDFLGLTKRYTNKILFSKDDFSKHIEQLVYSLEQPAFSELVRQHKDYSSLLPQWKTDLVNHSELELAFIQAVEASRSSANEEVELQSLTTSTSTSTSIFEFEKKSF